MADAQTEIDLARAEHAMREFLAAVGLNLTAQGMEDTPARAAELYAELFSGMRSDPQELCEHHLLPFFGTAHIVYRPHAGRVAGFGIFTQLVDLMARRPQLQECLTEDIAREIERGLGAEGVLVVLDARQLCMTMRGERAHGTRTTTSACRGIFREDKTKELQAWQMLGEWDSAENISIP